MEVFFKDQAVVVSRRFIGNNDVALSIYTKSMGIESVVIQNGQFIKNLPYTYLDKFTYFEGVFIKFRNDKIYINDIDKVYTLGLFLSRDYNNITNGYRMLDLIYKYSPYPDGNIYNLLKKSLYHISKSKDGYKIFLSFLVKFNYLLGIYDPKKISWDRESFRILSTIFKTKVQDAENLKLDRYFYEKLYNRLMENLNRWLS
ncbi:MAG: hypothetical protein N2Z81_05950 [Hydrogenothermaceae bacterium]|nr:hypothetical protein [Hydrogenothermaceae bacterium]